MVGRPKKLALQRFENIRVEKEDCCKMESLRVEEIFQGSFTVNG